MASLPLSTTPNPPNSPIKPFESFKKYRSSETHLPGKVKSSQILRKSYINRISSLCKEGLLHEAFSVLTQMEHDDLYIGPEVYGELLQGCLYDRRFFQAEDLFLRQLKPNVFSWAAMIGMHCRLGFYGKALMDFCQMLESGIFPDNFAVPNALKASSALQWIGFGKGIHGYVWKMGFASCVYVLSSLVDFYGKCGALEDANNLFEEMPERTVISWNSMLVGFVHNGLNEEAMELFYAMRTEGVHPTRVSIASFLSASANLGAVEEGRQGHAIAVLSGLQLDNILGSSIINFYCKIGLVEEAEIVFNEMVERDVVTWNLLISGYLQDGQIDKALYTCCQMKSQNFKLDSVTLTSIIMACANSCKLELGKVGHGYSIRNGIESDTAVACSIVGLYASCGRIGDARQVFRAAITRDLALWNAMISAYAHFGMSSEALKLFYQMQLEGVPPNVVSWNSTILGFLRNGKFSEAQDMFSQMQLTGVRPNLTTWATLISGLAQNGFLYEAINLYGQMQEEGRRPCSMIVVGVLLACTNAVALHYGMVIHGHIIRQGLLSSISVTTSLIDMYVKCGQGNIADSIKFCSNEPLMYSAVTSDSGLQRK
ncbi:pentatricopeptide repeat-containing protein At5g55740, chloroplastic-like [Typha angustifolia]|uniref:pentatricopeptide repeat-containing protein At5g55740, chloroplastic-like n=1 Tax=Typha angustifolia TaxID=59011 RepID=UPI003C2D3BF4